MFPFMKTDATPGSSKSRLDYIKEHPEKFDMSKSTPKDFALDMLNFFLKIITIAAVVFFAIVLLVDVNKVAGIIAGIVLLVAALVVQEFKTRTFVIIRICATIALIAAGILLGFSL